MDRVQAMGRIYGGGKYYENGLGKSQKRRWSRLTGPFPLVAMEPTSLESVLKPVEYEIFWFNGFSPLDPFVAWYPARISISDRAQLSKEMGGRLRQLTQATPRLFPSAR